MSGTTDFPPKSMTSDQVAVDHSVVQIFADATRVAAAIDEIAALGYAPASIGVVANRLSPLRLYLTTQARPEAGAVSSGILGGLAECGLADLGEVIGLGWIVGHPPSRTDDGLASSAPLRLETLLTGAGIRGAEAKVFGEAVRRGATLVGVVGAHSDNPGLLEDTMQRFGGRDAARCGADYRASGWAA